MYYDLCGYLEGLNKLVLKFMFNCCNTFWIKTNGAAMQSITVLYCNYLFVVAN